MSTGVPASFRARAVAEKAGIPSNAEVSREYFRTVVRCSALSASARAVLSARLSLGAGEGPLLRRPLSLYAADTAACTVEFPYKITGAGTRGLATLGAGDTFGTFGPFGRGSITDPSLRHLGAVGRGAGLVTPGTLAQGRAGCRLPQDPGLPSS